PARSARSTPWRISRGPYETTTPRASRTTPTSGLARGIERHLDGVIEPLRERLEQGGDLGVRDRGRHRARGALGVGEDLRAIETGRRRGAEERPAEHRGAHGLVGRGDHGDREDARAPRADLGAE